MNNKSVKATNTVSKLLDISKEVEFLFTAPKVKKDRDREVISDRFGLTGTKAKTLEEIGKNLGVTRERVRQIEKNTIRKFTEFMSQDLRGQEISQVLIGTIERNGNIIRGSEFERIILGENADTKAKHRLEFIIACISEIGATNDTPTVVKAYFVKPLSEDLVEKIIKTSVEYLKKENKPVEESTLVRELKKDFTEVAPKSLIATVETCKVILRTDTGHLGLSHWRDINPKSIKDKTYYILKKHQKPLHYTEIAKHIQNFGGKEKAVTRQAVHNELIRDNRFVLIGRGIYALSEWGYSAGVVEEVIETVLYEAGRPMHKDDIINEVLKRRIVKETTILLNLQKGRFKRVARATYTIANKEG